MKSDLYFLCFFFIFSFLQLFLGFFFKLHAKICMSGDIYLKGEAMPICIEDQILGVVLCCLIMELHIVTSIRKYGNNYFKRTIFFGLNRLNSIVGSCHLFNCINYLLHTLKHTVQLVWGKLIIAVCFKSVLHPGLTTLSHFLAEMKELRGCSRAVVTDARLGCKPCLKCLHHICSGTRFVQALGAPSCISSEGLRLGRF